MRTTNHEVRQQVTRDLLVSAAALARSEREVVDLVRPDGSHKLVYKGTHYPAVNRNTIRRAARQQGMVN